jgi:hypothetical protein
MSAALCAHPRPLPGAPGPSRGNDGARRRQHRPGAWEGAVGTPGRSDGHACGTDESARHRLRSDASAGAAVASWGRAAGCPGVPRATDDARRVRHRVLTPDAVGIAALWPWVAAPPPRERCATRGCTERPRKPAIGDAPAAIVLCPACRVAAGYDAPAPVGPTPCAAAGCEGIARPMRACDHRELEPYCPPCRHRGHIALIRGHATRETVAAYLAAGRARRAA